MNGQLLASHSRRRIGPSTQGAIDAVHLETLEVAIVHDGLGIGQIQGRREAVSPGHYTLIPPGVVHSSWTEEQGLEESVVHLRQRGLLELGETLGVDAAQWPQGTYKTTDAVSTGLAALAGEDGDGGLSLGRELLLHHLGPLAAAEKFDVDPRLAAAARLMRSNPAEQRSLQDLADVATLSAPHFNRLFKEAYGHPPMAYLRRERLRMACAQLVGTERNLTEIAHGVGFSSSGRLSEAFAQVFQQTATEWRRAQRSHPHAKSLNSLADSEAKPPLL